MNTEQMRGFDKWWKENEAQYSSDACHMSEYHMASVVWQAAMRQAVPKAKVKIRVNEYERIFLHIGVQSFMLDYCPEDEHNCTAREQAEWMAKQLKTAISNITPCVNIEIAAAQKGGEG